MFFCALQLLAQREAANWYFGDDSGLDFNNGYPEVLSNGKLSTTEGCSTISDSSGNLLFYTDGSKVWNKNHAIMTNGQDLKGNYSSSQSTIIIPNVDDQNIYYIFTADVSQSYEDGGTGNGFNYSIVDLSLSTGLGGVTSKNINLLPEGSEKVSAVSALDNSGFWVITQAKRSFYAFKVTANGVNSTPIVSNIGPSISNFNNIRGSIKCSPNGKKIAVTYPVFSPEMGGSINLYDFNVNTGVVSNETIIVTDKVFYGVEFSSNSSMLYVSAKLIDDNGGFPISTKVELYQYNLSAAVIERSEYLIYSFEEDILGDLAGSLQIGLDKKIYHSLTNNYLSVIREPNLAGASCDYRAYSVDLGGGLARFGLPAYEQASFESILKLENLCFNNATQFGLETTDQIQSVHWDFGDPDSGLENESDELDPIHSFLQIGTYAVTITVEFFNRESHTYLEFVEINEIPIILDNVVLTQCDVDANDDGISVFNLAEAKSLFYQGEDDLTAVYYRTLQDVQNNENTLNASAYQNEFDNQVIFAKVYENVECYSVTEITLNVERLSNLGTYSTVFICNNSDEDQNLNLEDILFQLSVNFPNTDISLYRNENDALLENQVLLQETMPEFSQVRELYFRIENFNACRSIGKVEIDVVASPEVEDQLTVFCIDSENILDAGAGFVTYTWSTGETTQRIQIDQPGMYSVEVSLGADCTDVFNLNAVLSEAIEIVDILIDDFRPNNSVMVILKSYEGNLKYSLDAGNTFTSNRKFVNVSPGLYDLVVVRDDCNTAYETILVGGYPNFFTPNGDGVNDKWKIKKPEFFQNAKIEIYDRFGKLLKTMGAFDSWDGTYDGKLLMPSDYWFSIMQDHKVVYGHFSLKL